ncbi:Mur ligase domain-containing protein, partial [Micromonospora harpali]
MPGNPRPRTVTGLRLGELADRLAVEAPAGAADQAVTGVTHASQEVRPGDQYAALPGDRRHGAEFAAVVAAAGALAALTDPAG